MSVELISTSLKIERNEQFLSLDDYLNIVILSGPNGFGYVSLTTKERVFYCSDKNIKDAKFSPNGVYTAAQFNDTDIEILNTKEGKRVTQTTKYKSTKGTVVLGFYFISTSLLIVTNTSLELYQIISTPDTIVCKFLRDAKIKIQSFIFSTKSGILLSYAGDKNNTIQPYKFTNSYIEKLPKYSIESNTILDMGNLHVTLLYGKTYCIYGDHNQISFYELNPETVYRSQVIKLILPGTNHIQFVDNLMIVHYNELKVSMVYDLKMLKEDFPISAIPMSYKPPSPLDSNMLSNSSSSLSSSLLLGSVGGSPGGASPIRPNLTASSSSALLQQRELAQQQQAQQHQLYANTWKYVHPNYIFDSGNGNWYEVRLNFEKIAHFFQVDNAEKIIPFLQQRSSQNAKQALLTHIRTIIENKKESLDSLGKIFDSLNRDLFVMTNRNNTSLLQKHLTAKKPGEVSSTTPTSELIGNPSSTSYRVGQLSNTIASGLGLSSSNADDEDLMGDLQSRQSSNDVKGNSNVSVGGVSNLNIGMSGSRRLNTSGNNLNTSSSNSSSSSSVGVASGANGSFIGSLNRSPTLNSSNSSVIGNSGGIGGLRSTVNLSELVDENGVPQKPLASLSRGGPSNIIVNSEDMYEHVFNPIYDKIILERTELKELTAKQSSSNNQTAEQELKRFKTRVELDSKYLIAIVTEYLRSLNFTYCGKSDKLFNLLLSLFIDNNMFSQLHQFLQYYVVEDAESIAYKLLSIGETYPPAQQLSLDMFKRLNMPSVIISMLLEKKQVLLALRFMRSTKTKVDPEIFLGHAYKLADDNLFFSVYKFFESTNSLGADNCEKYVKIYKEKFGVNGNGTGSTNNSNNNSSNSIS